MEEEEKEKKMEGKNEMRRNEEGRKVDDEKEEENKQEEKNKQSRYFANFNGTTNFNEESNSNNNSSLITPWKNSYSYVNSFITRLLPTKQEIEISTYPTKTSLIRNSPTKTSTETSLLPKTPTLLYSTKFKTSPTKTSLKTCILAKTSIKTSPIKEENKQGGISKTINRQTATNVCLLVDPQTNFSGKLENDERNKKNNLSFRHGLSSRTNGRNVENVKKQQKQRQEQQMKRSIATTDCSPNLEKRRIVGLGKSWASFNNSPKRGDVLVFASKKDILTELRRQRMEAKLNATSVYLPYLGS
ncbi:hypothetical protein ACQ4LE_003646, partial [Meloidogyne hapla]